jgi:hypothetical protein
MSAPKSAPKKKGASPKVKQLGENPGPDAGVSQYAGSNKRAMDVLRKKIPRVGADDEVLRGMERDENAGALLWCASVLEPHAVAGANVPMPDARNAILCHSSTPVGTASAVATADTLYYAGLRLNAGFTGSNTLWVGVQRIIAAPAGTFTWGWDVSGTPTAGASGGTNNQASVAYLGSEYAVVSFGLVIQQIAALNKAGGILLSCQAKTTDAINSEADMVALPYYTRNSTVSDPDAMWHLSGMPRNGNVGIFGGPTDVSTDWTCPTFVWRNTEPFSVIGTWSYNTQIAINNPFAINPGVPLTRGMAGRNNAFEFLAQYGYSAVGGAVADAQLRYRPVYDLCDEEKDDEMHRARVALILARSGPPLHSFLGDVWGTVKKVAPTVIGTLFPEAKPFAEMADSYINGAANAGAAGQGGAQLRPTNVKPVDMGQLGPLLSRLLSRLEMGSVTGPSKKRRTHIVGSRFAPNWPNKQ